MALSNPSKQRLIRALQTTRNKGDELELELLLQGRKEDAKKVRESTARLTRQVRALIDAAKRTWRGRAAALEKDMRRRNAALQTRIRAIRRKVQTADQVVKAVDLIEDAVTLAAKVIARS